MPPTVPLCTTPVCRMSASTTWEKNVLFVPARWFLWFKFNIREFIDKFGFIAELNDDGYGGYIGDLIVTNKELFLDKVLCCGFNTSLAKCIYVNNSAEVVFFFEEGLAKGSVKVGFAENDMNSEPTMIGWEPLG